MKTTVDRFTQSLCTAYIQIDLLLAIAEEHPKVKKYPPAAAFVTDFADSSINYKVLFWVANPLDAFAVGSDLRREIWKRFEKEGITIPFPQRQVYPMQWPPSLQQSLPSGPTTDQESPEEKPTGHG